MSDGQKLNNIRSKENNIIKQIYDATERKFVDIVF